MNAKKLLVNIFSQWTHLVVVILLSFFISPIIVHQLGNELYGIWTLIVSITGYFTLFDFGINTAIVRFISMYVAQHDTQKANDVYNTAFVAFLTVSGVIIIITVLLALCFADIFHIASLPKSYLSSVFFIVGVDIAFSILFSVMLATLSGLQEFFRLNMISIVLTLLKNLLLVLLLLRGYTLLTMAIVQLTCNLPKYLYYARVIRMRYPFLALRRSSYSKAMFGQIFQYSVYSFITSIAGRIIFLSDSLVIGSLLNVSEVTFYAIPATLLEYVGKFIMAIPGVLIPVISSQDALGEREKNRTLYLVITQYVLVCSLPVMFVLFTVGDNFISIWMGAEYGLRSTMVVRLLVIGYAFLLPQWVSYAILSGTSKHQFTAYTLTVEALANVGISIALAKNYGIEGVALGTMIPLIVVNVCIIPPYACHMLSLSVVDYFCRTYLKPGLFLLGFSVMYASCPVTVSTYGELCVYSAVICALWAVFAFAVVLERAHRQWCIQQLYRLWSWRT